jgi:hypothetical protein
MVHQERGESDPPDKAPGIPDAGEAEGKDGVDERRGPRQELTLGAAACDEVG